MGSIFEGARQVINNCLHVKNGESVLIITDNITGDIGQAIEAAAFGATMKVVLINLNKWPRPLKEFPEEIRASIKAADVSIYAAAGEPGELQTFRSPLLRLIESLKHLRHAHMVGVTAEIMTTGMAVDYSKVAMVTKLVQSRVKNGKEFRIKTSAGTHLNLSFKKSPSGRRWHACDGTICPGEWSNLPDGEVFTFVVEASGTIVVDSLLGDFFTEKYKSLFENPLRFEVADSRVVKGSVVCENTGLSDDFISYVFNTDAESDRLGEFAFGTNIYLQKLIGNFLQDEKFPGVHLALGDPLSASTGANWESKAHVDILFPDATVWMDGEMIMGNGKYLFLPKELYQ
jgi:Leucyl aminopeptidase (aminopeptidase T)